MRVKFLLAIAFLFAAAEVSAQSSPLIMKHADSLAVARKRGNLICRAAYCLYTTASSSARNAPPGARKPR